MWVASEGGYLVKYLLTTKGKAAYFGEGVEGTISFDYELTDINKPVQFSLPDDCPLGIVDAPKLPDASNVVEGPGILTFETSTSLKDAAAFYQKQLPDLGWKASGEPNITDVNALLIYTRGPETMSVVIAIDKDITKVRILLGRPQK
jgi:hypothetical protein